MVVWLKPCESRSSPGALPQIPVPLGRGFFIASENQLRPVLHSFGQTDRSASASASDEMEKPRRQRLCRTLSPASQTLLTHGQQQIFFVDRRCTVCMWGATRGVRYSVGVDCRSHALQICVIPRSSATPGTSEDTGSRRRGRQAHGRSCCSKHSWATASGRLWRAAGANQIAACGWTGCSDGLSERGKNPRCTQGGANA